jgi:conjugal transfer pilus assembly protein TraD
MRRALLLAGRLRVSGFLGIAIVFSAPKLGMIACVLLAIAMTALRLFHASKLLRYKLSLVGKPMAFMSAGRMKTALPAMGANLWLGWGYRWEPMHTQRAYEILKRNINEVYPPQWWLSGVASRSTHAPRKAFPGFMGWTWASAMFSCPSIP